MVDIQVSYKFLFLYFSVCLKHFVIFKNKRKKRKKKMKPKASKMFLDSKCHGMFNTDFT